VREGARTGRDQRGSLPGSLIGDERNLSSAIHAAELTGSASPPDGVAPLDLISVRLNPHDGVDQMRDFPPAGSHGFDDDQRRIAGWTIHSDDGGRP
jgi:hypothetical protein